MKKCNRCLLSLVLVVCLVLSMFSGVVAAPSATLIVTTPSGYTSAAAVNYKTVNGYLTNWGARGEDCGFLTTYAQGFYTGSYQYSTLSKVSGGTSTSNAPSSSLYSSLQTLMVSNHTFFTKYGSTSSSDCKNIYQYTDCMLGDPTYVSTLYRGLKVGGPWDSGVSYNQEHIWPQSKCLGTASTSDIGDIMHLRPANPSENSSRGNTAYGESSSYYDPGVSVRGDCARTLLYMYVRWGNTGNMWGTDGVIESLDVLLRWIKEDPVDTWEMGHNDAVQSITGTRNVFVDYPEYAYLLFGRSVPSDLTTPSNGGNPGGSTGGSTGGSVATLVTNASTLKAGDQIIIAALDYDVAMSTTQNTNNRGQATVTKSGSTLTFGSDAQVLTLVAGSTADTFALDTGSGYLTAASSTANNLKTKSLIDANSSWTLGVDANTGAAFITANGTYTRNLVRYNYSSDLFSCYAANNTQKDVAIYRLGGSSGSGSGDSGDSGSTATGAAIRVTTGSSLKAGDQIIIAAMDYDAALGTTQNSSNRSQGSVIKSGSTLLFGSDVQVLTLESGTVSGTFALQAGSGKYLYAPSSASNQLKTTSSVVDNGSWSITIDSSTGIASVVAAGTSTRNVLRYNASSGLFSCYAANNTQKDLAIYRIAQSGQCNHSYSSRISTYATCTKAGVRTYTCTLCGDSYTESIAAKGHSYTSSVTSATCTEQGYTTYTCSGCGDSYTGSYTSATGHSYTSKVTTAATCTGSGVKTYTCSRCYHSYTEAIAATGHSYTSKVTYATCTAQGYTTYTCSACGDSYTGNYTNPKGHSYSGNYCTVCGAVNPNCTHSYTSKVTTAATCTTAGVRTYTCGICGDSYTAAIAATGHKYSGGSCTVCGAYDPNYSVTDTGYVRVFDASKLASGKYVIVANNGTDDLAMGTTLTSGKLAGTAVTVNGTLITGSGLPVWTLEVVGGGVTISMDGQYLAYNSSTNFKLSADPYVWTAENGDTGIILHSSVTTRGIYLQISSSKFGAYATSNVGSASYVSNLQLYKYQVGTQGCTHSYSSKVTTAATCTAAGVKTFTCGLCGNSYTQAIPATGHSFNGGSCTACGAADPSVSVDYTYYLVGYINGMDYGCEADYENNGIYKFVNGKLTATFTTDSYVFVKTEGNSKWLLSEAYCTDTTCTFYEGGSEKMFVPGNVSVTFTLTKNADGSVTVSYTTGGTTACSHTYVSSVTSAATCTKNGIKTYTCTKCSSAYTQAIPATGHSYVNGSCTVCGAADPTVGGQTYYLVGYINGMDYGCEADYENMGIYKFADGKLTATFTTDSYVFVKTEGNGRWLLSDAYCTDTSCTFKEGGSEKMYVPGNVAVTFTLKENGDGSVTLSYTTGAATASVVPTLTLKAPTLEFKDTVTVNALYTAENTQDVEEMGMVTYSARAANVSVDTAEHVIPGATYDATTNRYVSSSQGIYAKHLGDTVYLAIYARLKDGTYAYSKQASYSAVQYATNQLKNSTDVALKQLVAAMLNYGAEAQLYFGHNTGSLANSSLTAAQKALPAAYNSSMISSVPAASASKQGIFANNSGFSKRVPAISFEGAFCINYFFTPNYAPTSGITLYYWNAADYNAAATLTTANATGSLRLTGSGIGEYRGDIVGIAAKSLSDAVYVAAVYQSGGITWTSGALGYSIGSYCGSQSSKGGDISGLAEATAVYGYHARQYFG